MHLNELKVLHVSEVLKQAEELEIENTGRMRKQELMSAIIKKRAKMGEQVFADGVLEILPDGFGFLRNPVSNYTGATRLTIDYAQPGDIVQYENIDYPTSWVSGVHTLLIVGVNGDGTFDIVQSNIPGGSGLVTEVTDWVPAPPAGFQAVVWRF